MSVKVSLSTELIKEQKFPKLMISLNDVIVFFTKEKTGFVIKENYSAESGYYSEDWAMSNFKDYEGEITLKNE